MPQLINNRIYLDPTKEFSSEQNEAVNMKMDFINYPIIIVEDDLESNSKYDIQVEGNMFESSHLVLKYWMNFFNIKEPSAKYVRLGTWKDSFLDDEIRNLFTIIKEYKYPAQTEFVIEKSDKLIDYIRNKFENNYESLSWFNFYFYNVYNEEKYEFVSSHYGSEIYCFDLTSEQIEELLTKLDGNNLFIRVSKMQESSMEA